MANISAEYSDAAQRTILDIARHHLDLATLEPRNMDSLDFQEQSVGSIKAALQAAYAAGFQAARTRAK